MKKFSILNFFILLGAMFFSALSQADLGNNEAINLSQSDFFINLGDTNDHKVTWSTSLQVLNISYELSGAQKASVGHTDINERELMVYAYSDALSGDLSYITVNFSVLDPQTNQQQLIKKVISIQMESDGSEFLIKDTAPPRLNYSDYTSIFNVDYYPVTSSGECKSDKVQFGTAEISSYDSYAGTFDYIYGDYHEIGYDVVAGLQGGYHGGTTAYGINIISNDYGEGYYKALGYREKEERIISIENSKITLEGTIFFRNMDEAFLYATSHGKPCDQFDPNISKLESLRFSSSENFPSELTPTPEVYVNINSQNIYKDEMLQVFFNTSVLPNMTEKYDVYFSISWDDVTIYDNSVDLVQDKQPLYKNIVIPELLEWIEREKLRYVFPDNIPRRDYVLGLHLIDSKGNLAFENFSSVSYYPEASPFITTSKNKQSKKASSIRQEKSSNKTCHLGGIRASVENNVATELDTATKRSMLALQMGSYFEPKGRLNTLYQGVKGSYNLFKKGKTICNNVSNFETLFNNYDKNIDYYALTDEQSSNLFAIELLTSALSLTKGGELLYSGFDSNDLMNGIKDYYNYQNKQFHTISSLNNYAKISIKFVQPKHWFLFSTDAVKLKVTATPVFTYADGNESTKLADIPKNVVNSGNIAEKTIDLGEADSDKTSFSNINYKLKTTLKRGLYLIKASTKDGTEVFRDTIHVRTEGQEHTMIINR